MNLKERLIEMTTVVAGALPALCLTLAAPAVARAQTAAPVEHDAEMLGVRAGMDVPTAPETVFVNAKRKPGEERPDVKRNEGQDVRVIYKKLADGQLAAKTVTRKTVGVTPGDEDKFRRAMAAR